MLFLGRMIHFFCCGGIEVDWNDISVTFSNVPVPFLSTKPVDFVNFDDDIYSRDLKKLMLRLLSSSPVKRPSAYEVLEYSKRNNRISTPNPQPDDMNGIIVKPKFETRLKRAWQHEPDE